MINYTYALVILKFFYILANDRRKSWRTKQRTWPHAVLDLSIKFKVLVGESENSTDCQMESRGRFARLI